MLDHMIDIWLFADRGEVGLAPTVRGAAGLLGYFP